MEWLHALPERVSFGGELFCHASPLSDEETFGREPGLGDERLLAGEHRRLIVFGHSHVQFRRPGPSQTVLVNPGSVGIPLDGDRRAAWALRSPDGEIELRRTEYDSGAGDRASPRDRNGVGGVRRAAARVSRPRLATPPRATRAARRARGRAPT